MNFVCLATRLSLVMSAVAMRNNGTNRGSDGRTRGINGRTPGISDLGGRGIGSTEITCGGLRIFTGLCVG